MFKCCWNCGNGFTCCSTRDAEIRFNSSKRLCCASVPVSNHGENPFKQRYCKQFEVPYRERARMGHFSTKDEAAQLNTMGEDELVQYWTT